MSFKTFRDDTNKWGGYWLSRTLKMHKQIKPVDKLYSTWFGF